jgi:hypothetical protein
VIVKIPVEGSRWPDSMYVSAAGTTGWTTCEDQAQCLDRDTRVKHDWRNVFSVDGGSVASSWTRNVSRSGNLMEEVWHIDGAYEDEQKFDQANGLRIVPKDTFE